MRDIGDQIRDYIDNVAPRIEIDEVTSPGGAATRQRSAVRWLVAAASVVAVVAGIFVLARDGEDRLEAGPGVATTTESRPPDTGERADGPVEQGPMSDLHVEATDLVFAECPAKSTPPTDERRRALGAFYLGLLDDGILEEPEFVNGIDATFDLGVLRVVLSRRYQPTIDWFAARVPMGDLCFDVITPPGYYTGPPDLMDWEVDWRSPVTPDSRVVDIGGVEECGIELLGSTWTEMSDRVEVAVLYRDWPGASNSCPGWYPVEVGLAEPLGDRALVAASSPVTLRLSDKAADVRPGDTVELVLDSIAIRDQATIGDDVMIQRLDDPSVQIQVTGVFGDRPAAGPPAAIVQDRWAIHGVPRVVLPEDMSAGDYSIVFIDDPHLNGLINVGE